MSRPPTFHVAIVGSGPAGAATALALLRGDPSLRVALLEKGRHPRRKLCGGAFPERIAAPLSRLGLDLEAMPIPSVRTTAVRLQVGGRPLDWPVVEPIRVVERAPFDAWLADRAGAAGARLLEGCKVVGLSGEPGAFRLALAGGERVTAAAVVGADGAAGVVRTLARVAGPARLARLVQLERDGESEPNELLLDLSPPGRLSGYGWRFPLPSGPGSPRRIEVGLFDRGGRDLRREMPDAERWVFRCWAPGTDVSAPGVLLVGDAAGGDPLLAEGIRPALEMGLLAATHLLGRRGAGDPTLGGWREAIEGSPLGKELAARARLARLADARFGRLLLGTAGRLPGRLLAPLLRAIGRRGA